MSHNHSHVVYLPPIFYLNYLIQGSSLPSSAGAFCVGTSCWVGSPYGEESEVMRVPAMLHRC